jgi:BMFP domain-containing protein YqiC
MRGSLTPDDPNIGHHRSSTMKPTDLFNDLQNKVSEALRNSPAKDIEKNVRSMMTQGFARLDLVTREEFDVQSQVLARTRARLEELEARVVELERRAGGTPTGGA